jgi:hypothetical protein
MVLGINYGSVNFDKFRKKVSKNDLQSAQNPNVIDLSKLEKVMSDLPISIKRPMEEAVSGLKIPLEQLLQSMGQQLDVQQKQLKGINGLSNDMLRG